MIKETEAVQIRDTDIRTSVLYPSISPDLATHLLIDTARVFGSAELVWHGATQEKLATRVGRLHLDRYAYIEAASNPLTGWGHGAYHLVHLGPSDVW